MIFSKKVFVLFVICIFILFCSVSFTKNAYSSSENSILDPAFLAKNKGLKIRITEHATEAAISIMNQVHRKYETYINDINFYFTEDGLKSYEEALISSGTMEKWRKGKHKKSATLRSNAKVIFASDKGAYTEWFIEVPLTIYDIHLDSLQNDQNVIIQMFSPNQSNAKLGVGKVIVYDDEIADDIKKTLNIIN